MGLKRTQGQKRKCKKGTRKQQNKLTGKRKTAKKNLRRKRQTKRRLKGGTGTSVLGKHKRNSPIPTASPPKAALSPLEKKPKVPNHNNNNNNNNESDSNSLLELDNYNIDPQGMRQWNAMLYRNEAENTDEENNNEEPLVRGLAFTGQNEYNKVRKGTLKKV